MKRTYIGIIGAGASGLMAAYQAAVSLQRKGSPVSVTVLEGNDRAGKKLLATGNGRCNLTNKDVSSSYYHGSKEIEEILQQVSVQDIIDEFEKIGILCRTDEVGRVYPYNLQASAVLKALRFACEEKGVQFLYDFNVFSILHTTSGFQLKAENGDEILCQKCILSSGGQASPNHSCGENGYALAKQVGHSLTKLSPALTSVYCKDKILSSLKGMRCKAKVTLKGDGDSLYTESGEVIFADKALSGICIFNLSVLIADYLRFGTIAKKEYKNLVIELDLAEDMEIFALQNYLKQLCLTFPNRKAIELLSGVLNMKVGEEMIKSLKIGKDALFSSLTTQQIGLVTRAVKAWNFPVSGLAGWDKAQITAGGIPLKEIQTHKMQSCKIPALYLAGEILDVHGDCGGFNLHFAWVSGLLAGRAAAQNIISI